MKRILSIAGSDSGGGAGIQADIKTISALGGFATTAITALTAQNTMGVREVQPVPASHVRAQIEAVLEDIGADAIKIGMLHRADVIETVAEILGDCKQPIVLDPVMVATSGDRLLDEAAMRAMKELLPLATVITPNLPETEALLGYAIESREAMEQAAAQLASHYGVSVLLKGGHLENGTDEMADVLFANGQAHWMVQPLVNTGNTHGTGCTLSSALATYMGQGSSLVEAAKKAQAYVYGALQRAPDIGKGSGPLYHFWNR